MNKNLIEKIMNETDPIFLEEEVYHVSTLYREAMKTKRLLNKKKESKKYIIIGSKFNDEE